ncbi:carbohydrate ABC transporter permease [Dactylosporangium sucinum]|uniref:Sugar ABC transporter permease n=1 Tax=Dactylosporangium sucinum TaxID=1424081 RepID=A0A917X712_9ACTN|nr:carbohydrate ABC transporter permease [Dactylosporangium sucinum]GGM83538.1 sugar ABC transporter permease [Dactylosporangium sucinum]
MIATPVSRRIVRWARLLTLGAGAVVMVLPLVYMVSVSFTPNVLAFAWPPRLMPQDPTVANYVEAWNTNDFGRYFANSALVACATTLLTTLLSALAAYAFARFTFPGRSLLFWTLMLGLMVPSMVILLPQFLVATTLGLTNSLTGLVVFYVGAGIAFNTFLLRGFFERVPVELDESMTVDGAGPLRRFVALYLPIARPALATSAVFAFLAAWDEYSWALTSITDPEKSTLPLAIAQFQGAHLTSWSLVFAASLIGVGPVVLIYLLGQKHFVTGLTSGALKS